MVIINQKGTVIILLTVVIIIILYFFRQPIMCYYGTKYTDGFSQEKFDKIQIGMTKAEVIQLLGEPFYKSENDSLLWKNIDSTWFNYHEPNGNSTRWHYTKGVTFKNDMVVSKKDCCSHW